MSQNVIARLGALLVACTLTTACAVDVGTDGDGFDEAASVEGPGAAAEAVPSATVSPSRLPVAIAVDTEYACMVQCGSQTQVVTACIPSGSTPATIVQECLNAVPMSIPLPGTYPLPGCTVVKYGDTGNPC